VPLFAHVRWANFTPADVEALGKFRSVTVQVEPDAPIPCEAQARDVQARLGGRNASVPTLFYANVHFAEPNCAYFKEVAANPWLWLNDSAGRPVMPAGRFTWDFSVPGVAQWWAANVILAAGVEGGFGDSGCGDAPPAWFNATRAAAFSAGQREAHALATAALAALPSPGAYIANCPILPRNGDPQLRGVNGEMIESWCSDFQPKGAGPALWCKAELVEAVLLGARGANQTFLQARYYLNGANAGNPQFGLAAFLVAAWPGAFFGASRDWDWHGDWQNLLAWPWAGRPLGAPVGPPTMADPAGCAWTRVYANATSEVNVCAKHLFARISWVAAGTARAATAEEVGEVAAMPPLGARDGLRVREAAMGEACRAGEAEVGAPWVASASARACISRREKGEGGGSG